MHSIKIKKENVKQLIKEIIQVERTHSGYFKNTSVMDFCDLELKKSGFTISFSARLPEAILFDIFKIFNK